MRLGEALSLRSAKPSAEDKGRRCLSHGHAGQKGSRRHDAALWVECARGDKPGIFSIKRHPCVCENTFLEDQIPGAYFSGRKP